MTNLQNRIVREQKEYIYGNYTYYVAKGGTQFKGIWKQDHKKKFFFGSEGMRMGNGEDFTMRNFIVHIVYWIFSRWLNLEGYDILCM